ncbi:MAG: DUF167 domain-containing protein [Anaerolineae bacterium]|nr:DUF167 domain-containing protein [Anaerolineae bacterium]
MSRKFEITDAQHGAAFTVRVVTKADKKEVVGVQDDGSLKIRLTESPAGGAANTQLLEYLAEILEVDQTQIEIVAGSDKPNKIISVKDVTPGWVEDHLATDED